MNRISEKTFNSIDESTIDKYEIHDNFYIIPRVKGLSNSFQFLFSYEYKEKIKFFMNELKQISIEDLVKIRKDKYLNITSDI